MKQQKNKHSGALKVLCVGLMIGIVSASYATDSPIKVRHLVNEQNIVSIQQPKKYLLLPVQDNAPESKVYVVSDNQTASPAMNIRLARESVDYYVPIALSAYPEKGLAIDIQGLPQNAICWEHIQLSDTYDMNNRETIRTGCFIKMAFITFISNIILMDLHGEI